METENLDATEEASSTSNQDAQRDSSTHDDKPLSEVVAEAYKASTDDEPSDPSSEETEENDGGANEEEPSTNEDSQESEQEEETKTEGEEDKEDEESDESTPPKADVPFHNHPRWKEVLKERDEARGEIEALKPKAETVDALNSFCQQNDISEEDFQSALRLAALSKKDVKAFRDELNTMLESIDTSMGTRLPADLQKKVDDGVIDEETAKEVAKSRMAQRAAEANAKRTAEQSSRASGQAIASTLDRWETDQKKLDPSYDVRREAFMDRMQALWAQRQPRTPQEAVALAEEANKTIKARYAKTRPKPQTRKVLRSTGSSTSNKEDLTLDELNTDNLMKITKSVLSKHKA